MTKPTNDWDFGFALVSEEELRSLEIELAAKNKEITIESDQYKGKYDALYTMIMVLMRNLSAEPDKSYIFWPNRIEKVNEFIAKINSLK